MGGPGAGVASIAASVNEHSESSKAIVGNMERIAHMTRDNMHAVSLASAAMGRIQVLAQETRLALAKFQT